MKFVPLRVPGAYRLEIDRIADDRGFFARSWCAGEFEAQGLSTSLSQCSISFNKERGTLRGLHYQAAPHEETKVVRCTQGAIYDVLLDLRRDSAAYLQWIAVELTAENRTMVYIPEGVAHGFQTLTDSAEVFYQISVPYRGELARGVRWDDPAFAIQWPGSGARIISPRDRQYPDYEP